MRRLGHIGSARWRWSLVLATGAFVVGLAPLADGDLWWHLAAGREIVRTRGFLITDPFSSGALGRPWVDVHWLFQLAAYGVHALGGLRALVIAKCALVAVGALVLMAAVTRGAGPRSRAVFVPAFLAALFAARALLLLRPIIPTLVFVAVFFTLLERFRHEGRWAVLAPLPLLQIAWANVQALSMLGPALVAAYAFAMAASRFAGRSRWYPFSEESAPGVDPKRATRCLLATLGLTVAACFVTPYGARAVALPFALLGRLLPVTGNVYSGNVAENVPPWVLERTGAGPFGHVALYLGLLALCLVSARRVMLSHVVVVVALAALALASNRNVLLLYWLATPIAVMSAMPALRRVSVGLRRSRVTRGRRLVRALPASAAAAVLITVLTLGGLAAARETSLGEPAPWRAPTESTRIISERGGEGAIFAADQFGGFLMWRLGPAHRPYMDTRLVLRTAEEFEEYLSVVDEPQRFDAWEQDKGFAYVILPVTYPDRYLGLIAHLYAGRRWELIFTDGAETLFARRGVSMEEGASHTWNLGSPAVTERIVADVSRRFGDSPRLLEAARAQLATLDLGVGEPRQAERALAGLETPLADALRARSRLALGDFDGAAGYAGASLARDARDVRSLDVLALVAAHQGDSSKALVLLRRALEVNPYDDEAEKLLARWEGQ
jgi:hypothetical protein